MRPFIISLFLITLMISCTSASKKSTTEITSDDILQHIRYLASDDLKGRESGSAEEAMAANYIADLFRDYGLEPAGEELTYFQNFTINAARLQNPHAAGNDTSAEKRIARNVAALLQGRANSDEVIIFGAHYDHLGLGNFGSLSSSGPKIHNGADDNASGTAGLLELAEYFSEHKPEKDLFFIAFSGEEMGLLGSQYFVENPTINLENTIAMINLDMIGRMNNNKLLIFGTGTSENWEEILETANTDSLSLSLVPGGTGSSDHTSFYYKNIPVLHYFTDTHADYHRPSDDVDYINAEGEEGILQHIVRVVEQLDEVQKESFAFVEAPGQQRQTMTMNGPALGVLPDYGYEGTGMKITGVTEGRAADLAGLQSGDIIINIAGNDLEDIYAYMNTLNRLSEGQKTTITVLRDGKKLTFDLQL